MPSVELLKVAAVLKKPLDDLYELGKDKFKRELQVFRFKKNVNTLYRKISQVQKVKTIWQTEKPANLKTFYYPSKILVDEKPVLVSSIQQLPDEQNIVIQGTVGQGKSIFLRYLCYRELLIGSTVPVFFELRKISKDQSLVSYLHMTLEELGFKISSEFFDFLLSSGKLTLLLDGFDEIEAGKALEVLAEIEHLSSKHEHLKVIVTSRPDSGIEKLPTFGVYRVANLGPQDYEGILRKLLTEESQVAEIVGALNSSSIGINELLRTPLMMTLLVVAYKSESKIPERFSEFYENIFQTLLVRHDKSKPGYTRKRACAEINERELQEVFEAFCFLSTRDQEVTMSADRAYDTAEAAAKLTNKQCDAAAFVEDIEKVSCLLLREAFTYHFIHKSVQEYYAARFVSRRPEESAQKFYSNVLGTHWYHWTQVLNFLDEIDTYRIIKHLKIPDARKCLERLNAGGQMLTADARYKHVLSLVSIIF